MPEQHESAPKCNARALKADGHRPWVGEELPWQMQREITRKEELERERRVILYSRYVDWFGNLKTRSALHLDDLLSRMGLGTVLTCTLCEATIDPESESGRLAWASQAQARCTRCVLLEKRQAGEAIPGEWEEGADDAD
jgi:hypothetical protein